MTRFELQLNTDGDADVVDLTDAVHGKLAACGRTEGVLHLFVVGSTAALTTVEFEPGLVKHDLRAALQKVAPADGHYEHEATWNDDNGHSHIRASLIGPSITIPFSKKRLMTGQWQQVVLIDFDTRPRQRTVIATVLS